MIVDHVASIQGSGVGQGEARERFCGVIYEYLSIIRTTLQLGPTVPAPEILGYQVVSSVENQLNLEVLEEGSIMCPSFS